MNHLIRTFLLVLVAMVLVAVCTDASMSQTRRLRRQTFVVSEDRQHWEKVMKISPQQHILQIAGGSRRLTTNGGYSWMELASAAEKRAPKIVWQEVIAADSLPVAAPRSVIESNDGSSLYSLTTTNYQNRFFALDGSTGNEKWRLNFPSIDSTYSFQSLREKSGLLSSSGLVLNDPIFSFSGYKIDLQIEKATGNLLGYGYSLDAENSTKPGQLLENPEGCYLASNRTGGLYFATLDPSGSVVRSHFYGSGDFDDVYPSQLIQLEDGTLFVTATGAKSSKFGTWLIRLTIQGDSLWSFSGPLVYGDTNSLVARKSIQTNDNGILTLANSRSLDGSAVFIHLMKFSSDGELQWVKAYPSKSHTQGEDIVKLPDGGFAIVGVTGFDPAKNFYGPEDFYLLLLDEDAEPHEEYRWGVDGKIDQLTAAGVASDGSLLIGGITDAGSNFDDGKNYFARLSLGPLIAQQADQKSFTVSVYPNPAAGFVTIELPVGTTSADIVDPKGSHKLSLLNGSRVMSGALRVDLSGLAAGAYFLSIRTLSGIKLTPIVKY